jgi:exodeoxyribonuclease V alpha subunit
MSNLMQKLSTLRQEGIIEEIELELCRFFMQRQPGVSEKVLLAISLLSYLFRRGDVCLLLEKYAGQPLFDDDMEEDFIRAPEKREWVEALQESTVVGTPGDFTPFILEDEERLYMHKLWNYENELAGQLVLRSQQVNENVDVALLEEGLARLFSHPADSLDWQQVAAASAVRNKLSVISGGPGTGKTSTVVRILALLLEQAQKRNDNLSIALAAPTGKAAARLKESIAGAKDNLDIPEQVRSGIPDQAMTLHQLLGARKNSSAFKHNKENPVPYDLIVVDEASMVDQALMSKLLSALLDDAQLILLGDKDQLASVEAGAVLGDICDVENNQHSREMADWLKQISLDLSPDYISANPSVLVDNITLLTKSYRFDEESGIAQLAKEVNAGNADRALQVLSNEEYSDVKWLRADNEAELRSLLRTKIIDYFQKIVSSNSADEALKHFNTFRILSAHRRGPWGIEYLNRLVEHILQQEGLISKYDQWYPGKPVIINVNDYRLGLRNGDTGLCLPDGEEGLKIHFRHEDDIRKIAPNRLPEHNKAFALTVHKSQGSEFDHVLLILPDVSSKVLSRELIYTAITRARSGIDMLANKTVLGETICKKLQRSSGLRARLWER